MKGKHGHCHRRTGLPCPCIGVLGLSGPARLWVEWARVDGLLGPSILTLALFIFRLEREASSKA